MAASTLALKRRSRKKKFGKYFQRAEAWKVGGIRA
jgi:hypothetical protein